jgi:hypothetical protein
VPDGRGGDDIAGVVGERDIINDLGIMNILLNVFRT